MNTFSLTRAGRRGLETLAMLMIGDGVLCMVAPQRHVELWQSGPRLWRRMLEPFSRHHALTRAAGAAMVIAGVCLAARQRG